MLSQDQVDAIAALRDSTGILRPVAVVDAARPAGSPLHPLFEWDDATAGEAYRLTQARSYIRSVELVVTTVRETYEVVAYVHNPAASQSPGYVPTQDLRRSPDMLRQAMVAEINRILGVLSRTEGLARYLADPDCPAELFAHQIDQLTALRGTLRGQPAATVTGP